MLSAAQTTTHPWHELNIRLRAEPARLRPWIEHWQPRLMILCLGGIAVGASVYGATIGWWCDALQALYTGVKFPLVILLNTMGNIGPEAFRGSFYETVFESGRRLIFS